MTPPTPSERKAARIASQRKVETARIRMNAARVELEAAHAHLMDAVDRHIIVLIGESE